MKSEISDHCLDVDLSSTHGDMCRKIADRATVQWRATGVSDEDIRHSLDHPFPAIWPTFAEKREIKSMIRAAAQVLGVKSSQIQIDGIRDDGLINVLVRK